MYHTVIDSRALDRLMRAPAPHAALDVRERAAYERGHIFRATSLPRRLLEFRLPSLITAPATPIVAYDDDGGALATRSLATITAMGYTEARTLPGGLTAWRASGGDVVQGLNVPSKVFGERVMHEAKTPQIAPRDLDRRIRAREDLVILDARTFEEYARGCVPGAVNVPGGELVLRIGELVRRPDTTIVVHCGGRTRSYIGAESLRRMRLPNPIVALENGTMGWELAGLALERGAHRRAPKASAASRAAARDVAQRVAADDGVRFVAADELRSLWGGRRENNVAILDVRTADEYAAGHIAGAVWAPGGQAVQATDEYVAVRAATIALVCDDGTRSVMTASWLTRMGYAHVVVLSGGLAAWKAAGGSIARGARAPAPAGWDAAGRRTRRVGPGAIDGAVVIDVDQSDVFARGHLPGARWICRSRLEDRIGRIVPLPEAAVVVTCRDGRHSTLAAATLADLGYGGAVVLDGGTRAWEAAGRPLECGVSGFADEPDDVTPKPYERGRDAMAKYLAWEEALDEAGRSPKALL